MSEQPHDMSLSKEEVAMLADPDKALVGDLLMKPCKTWPVKRGEFKINPNHPLAQGLFASDAEF